jgi:micrococcal nuclease
MLHFSMKILHFAILVCCEMSPRYAILMVFLLAMIPVHALGDTEKGSHPAIEGQVVRVISGDSIALKAGKRVEEVQYIGVQAPRMRMAGEGEPDHSQKAFLLNAELVGGKIVHLEFDILPRDAAGKLLAYVFLLNGTFVNAELLLYGYGRAVYTPPNGMYRILFERLENQARSIGRGIWRVGDSYSLPSDGFRGPFIAEKKYKIFHRPGCRWIQGMPRADSAHFQSRKEAISQGYLPCLHCKP